MPTRLFIFFATGLGCFALACGGAGRVDEACRSNDDCEPTELCAAGFCGGFGQCSARPETCEGESIGFVCGCDGLTYDNQCSAELAGIRLQSTTPCACDDNSECVEGQYCELEDSCLNRGGCVPTPETCDPADTQEVCGCDGATYENECAAAQAGVRVSSLGSCECTSNEDCGASDYCGAIVCDGPGVCEPRSVTPCDPESPVEGCCDPDTPVTGCDGVVYPSECDAAMAGVRVRPAG